MYELSIKKSMVHASNKHVVVASIGICTTLLSMSLCVRVYWSINRKTLEYYVCFNIVLFSTIAKNK